MAKKKPIFLNSLGDFEIIDGTTDTVDESVIPVATTSTAGLLSGSDKTKLDTIQILQLEAGESITAGNLVYINASGKAMVATNTDPTKKAKAIALENASLGQIKNFAWGAYGRVDEIVTGLTAGSDVWLGTVGGATCTIPSSDGSIVQKVGIALDADSLLVNISETAVKL